ncbi:MAG: outer membrane lipoprotein chaperone LolA [Hydrogenophaga sp.]|uniref:outer membrane lipoprotein chaperone LolA n=1 Tax=Hydrogenophaga sp. TaxID=1904254 RepID=UPI001DA7AC2B|nr:outer membrane lipoprotein chaperone LolA [Hydrogenophaga sp.]MBX3610812.1 outer membrane lipoprotein chaperone LolA [Hydrogenophaga sp.]
MRSTALSLVMLWGVVAPAHADGLQALETFLRESNSASAEFTQVVTSPKRADETKARQKTSRGRFAFQRPDRFRFDYLKPFEQVIVADGQQLWLYDVDLNQVTVRRQQDALGSTPAAIIASSADLKALRESFELKSAPERDGLQWVEAVPRQRDGQLRKVRLGFSGNRLAALDIEDGLGQLSALRFTQWQSNPALTGNEFRFTPPAGADVIRP